MNVLRGIDAKSVQVELIDPISRIRNKELTDGRGVLTIKVDCFSPIGPVARSEVVGRKRFQEIAVGTNVIINNVENYSELLCVRLIDKLS